MFCVKCGKELSDGDMFCRFCGTPTQADKICVNSSEPKSALTDKKEVTLTIDRKSQVYLVNPPIKVVVDHSIRLSVDNGKTERVSLPVGTHLIELTGSIRSKSITVDLQSDTTLEIGFNRITGSLTAEILS